MEDRDTGVNGVPVTNSGVTGNQESSGVSPNTVEAQTPAKPFGQGAQASDAPSVTEERRIPYDRFKEVYDKMKGYESQLQGQQAAQVPQQPSAQPDAITQEIEKWTKVAEENHHDPRKSTEAMDSIAKLRATQIANETLQGLMQEQAMATAQQQFEFQRDEAWKQACSDYPELKIPNSDFYKSAEAEWFSDPGLQENPLGMLRAAESVYARLAKSGGLPNSSQRLEGGVRPAPQKTAESENREDRSSIRPGNVNDVLQYLEKHQPWKDSR